MFTTNRLSLVYEADQLNINVICMSEHLIKPIHKPYLAIRPSKHPAAGVVMAGQPYVHCVGTNGLGRRGLSQFVGAVAGIASQSINWLIKPAEPCGEILYCREQPSEACWQLGRVYIRLCQIIVDTHECRCECGES